MGCQPFCCRIFCCFFCLRLPAEQTQEALYTLILSSLDPTSGISVLALVLDITCLSFAFLCFLPIFFFSSCLGFFGLLGKFPLADLHDCKYLHCSYSLHNWPTCQHAPWHHLNISLISGLIFLPWSGVKFCFSVHDSFMPNVSMPLCPRQSKQLHSRQMRHEIP